MKSLKKGCGGDQETRTSHLASSMNPSSTVHRQSRPNVTDGVGDLEGKSLKTIVEGHQREKGTKSVIVLAHV